MQEARLKDIKIGVVLTGSHCTICDTLPQIEKLIAEGAEVFSIISFSVNKVDNRFYKVDDLKTKLRQITNKPIINSIVGAEPIGPEKMLDIIVVAPATGNTIAKLANGIVDTPALMAIKAHLRNQRPVVIAISTNDALGINAKNIGLLLNMKNIYFVPFRQDDPHNKANSVVANLEQIADTIIFALQGKQVQPLLLGPAQ
ncbi:Dipicolinic acid synthetase, subunit B [Syntrophomonas zehnderi OL-4]|uniref:Dipicolinic acid synthetase, subunit B n=1 Tax=Syntrophomonas zehnderi OL-4 TaxID=690567 RepID=A0A0E4C8X4_9FIRM|nr:dipicolinate synthase subunit B [Syntrophomonas zehnderi]CFX75680.1 Dipicolinic acid synthetase, subunit B [Syntrophomonas zehnderi OL-4]